MGLLYRSKDAKINKKDQDEAEHLHCYYNSLAMVQWLIITQMGDDLIEAGVWNQQNQ